MASSICKRDGGGGGRGRSDPLPVPGLVTSGGGGGSPLLSPDEDELAAAEDAAAAAPCRGELALKLCTIHVVFSGFGTSLSGNAGMHSSLYSTNRPLLTGVEFMILLMRFPRVSSGGQTFTVGIGESWPSSRQLFSRALTTLGSSMTYLWYLFKRSLANCTPNGVPSIIC